MSLLVDAAEKHQSGDLKRAVGLYQAFLGENAEHAEALNLYGLCMHELGNFQKADTLFSGAIKCDPEKSEFYQNRGAARIEMGKTVDALADFEMGLSHDPNNFRCLLEAGRISIDLQEIDKAIKFFEKAFEITKDNESAIVGLSYSLSLRGLQKALEKNYDGAISDLKDALKLCPETWEILYNLGNAYLKSGNYQLARDHYEKALELNNTNVDLLCNKGIASERLGAFSEAAAAYKKALVLDPKNNPAAYNYSLLLLKLGFYKKGLNLYEKRWETREFKSAKRQLNAPLWQGDNDLTDKKILCHAEQGLGDTIQFLRFCAMFDTSKTTVFVQCHSDLIEIAQTMQLQAEFYETGSELPDYDFHCPLMSLPRAFKYRPDSQKTMEPYLHPCRAKKEKFDKIFGPRVRPRVGLVLEGKPSHVHNHFRSVNAVDFIKVLPSGADYFLLQKELSSQTKTFVSKRSDVKDLSDLLINFSDTAAACSKMDLIITVDTAVAHLAGALGCRTFALLHYQSDWRWGLETKTTPWYSNMRLIRLQRDCNWPEVYAKTTANIKLIL